MRLRRFGALRYLLSSLGFTSVALLAVTDVLVTLDIPLLWSVDPTSASSAIAASIFNPAAVLLLITTTVLAQSSNNLASIHHIALPLGTGVLSVLGLCLSLAAFIVKRSKGPLLERSQASSIPFEAELGSLLACAVMHVAFFTVLMFMRRQKDTRPRAPALWVEKPGQVSASKSNKLSPLRTTTIAVTEPEPALRQRELYTPSPILCRSSWHVTYDEKNPRPTDSQVHLISNRNSADSTGLPTERHSPVSGTPVRIGDTLDAAAVESRLREVLAQAPPTLPYGTVLETIPQSRPTSRYYDDLSKKSLEQPPKTADSGMAMPDFLPHSSPLTSASETSSSIPSSPVREATGRPTPRAPPRHPARSATPNAEEAHIHPLFRTDSPIPPPMTSANTTITASPFSGQAIPMRSASRNRSRAPSPSLTRRPSRIDTGLQRSQSHSSLSNTPTTPIPEFILTLNNERMA